jgi:hypothetical protein
MLTALRIVGVGVFLLMLWIAARAVLFALLRFINSILAGE